MTIKLTPDLHLDIQGAPTSNAVQGYSMYTDEKTKTDYVFTIQHKSNEDQYLSRYKVTGGIGEYMDHMILKGFGHSQTIESYKYNGKEYLLIGLKQTEARNQARKWAVQIGRIQYKPGRTIQDYKTVTRISNIVKRRMECSLSTDKKMLGIYTISLDGRTLLFRAYNFDLVNKYLDKREGTYTRLSTFKELFRTKLPKASLISGSIQGIDFEGNKIVIIGGGTECRTITFNVIDIIKGGMAKVTRKVQLSHSDWVNGVEPEGIHITPKTIEIIVSNKKSAKRIAVYSLDRNKVM